MSEEVKQTSINNILRYMKAQLSMLNDDYVSKFWKCFELAFGDDFDDWRDHEYGDK